MHIACWMTKATETHSEYVIRIIYSQKNCYANAPHCYAYTHVPCPANLFNILGIIQNNLIETFKRNESPIYYLKIQTFVIKYVNNVIFRIKLYIQGVPGVKVSISGFISRANSESPMSPTHWSDSQRLLS